MWEDKLWENNWVVVAGKELKAESFQQNLQNKPVVRKKIFAQTYFIIHVEQYSVTTFCGSLGKCWSEIPSRWRCLVVPRTVYLSQYLIWWKLHKVWNSNRSELLQWFETDALYLALNLKLFNGRGNENYDAKDFKKEHKGKAKADQETEVEQEAPVFLGTQKKNFSQLFFSNFEVYINNQQLCNWNGVYAQKSFISNISRDLSLNTRGFWGYDYEKIADDRMEAPLSEPFFRRRLKMLTRPDGCMLYGELSVDFFSTSELLNPNMKIKLRIIKGPHIFLLD